jgi:cell division protease FtsH
LAYGDNEEEIFLGHSIARTQNMSDETQKLVDDEIHRIVDEGYKTAEKICKKYTKQLHIIGEGLLEYETLTGDEIKNLLKGKPPIRDYDDDSGGSKAAASAVPSTGKAKKAKPKKGGEPDTGGMEPQPS